ncbi:30S ribosomal protein S6 [Candidatus Vidania fulgoroideae]|nr:30S ribosomal protein S6 [Candidatus Vidania fulgoroideae]
MIYEIIIIFKENFINDKDSIIRKITNDIGEKKILRVRFLKSIKISYPIKKQTIVNFAFIFCKRGKNIKKILEKKIRFNKEILRYMVINVPDEDYKVYLKNDLSK